MEAPKKSETGFAILELCAVLGVVIIVGLAGWLIYTRRSGAAKSAELYPGWKSYCSKEGSLCLGYPSNWTLSTEKLPVVGTAASITNPGGSLAVKYASDCFGGSFDAPNRNTDSPTNDTDILSINSVQNTSIFKILKAIQHTKLNDNSAAIYANLYLATDEYISGTGAKAGANIHGDGAINAYFDADFTKAQRAFVIKANQESENDPAPVGTTYGTECITVGQPKLGVAALHNNFNSVKNAQSWLSSSDAQTANKILSSVTIND
jgi:hypothetical protein